MVSATYGTIFIINRLVHGDYPYKFGAGHFWLQKHPILIMLEVAA
jgi:hypothetical protein